MNKTDIIVSNNGTLEPNSTFSSNESSSVTTNVFDNDTDTVNETIIVNDKNSDDDNSSNDKQDS